MARDIEEFLRRAAERRQQQKGKQGGPAPEQAPPPKPREPLRPMIVEPEIVQAEIYDVEIVEANIAEKPIGRQKLRSEIRNDKREGDLSRESVSSHVDRHLDNQRLVDHAQSLGQRITTIHDKVERDVHKRLDRDISVIDDLPTITDDVRPSVAGEAISPIAADLLQMLSEPKTIRQAILMNEILKTPDWDDWD